MNHLKHEKARVLFILTGGTFCSKANDDNGELTAHADEAKEVILQWYAASEHAAKYPAAFDTVCPMNTLSENMTIEKWNLLLDELRKYPLSEYDGVIIAHGTDTLAYTSSLLSLALKNIGVPVYLVSSQFPLDREETNGYDNFAACVELICRHTFSDGVFVPYRNNDKVVYVHHGSHLRQCENYSDEFFSNDAVPLSHLCAMEDGSRVFSPKGEPLLPSIGSLQDSVLSLMPFVGIRYDRYSLDGVRAVIHKTFHSETVCAEKNEETDSYKSDSILWMIDRCKQKNIPLYISPCRDEDMLYGSSGDAVRHGALPVHGMTAEMAYVKLLIAVNLYRDEKDVTTFMKRNICGEFIHKL